jgi:O-succinylbenzoic acid--CoA ligase
LVVPKEDKEFGFRPVAFVKFENSHLAEEELKAILSKDLPKFKIPLRFYPWPEELMTQGIKITRKDFLTRI